jgi:enoyl-CoA hydratase/carnithine racemase
VGVLHDVSDGVATITLNRPERLNAATFELGEALRQAFACAGADPQVRAVVLTGAGRAFCAGDDVEAAWGDPRMAATLAELAGPRPPLTPEVAAILDCPVPTIAAVNGVALGIGMDLAVACDLIVAGESARFGQVYVTMGLMADVCGYWRLPQLIGPAAAAELLLTGEIIDAARAATLGLASRVVPDDELAPTAAALAGRIAANPPLAVRLVKEGLRRGVGRSRADLDELAAFVGNGLARLFATDDHREAVAAFVEKRAPQFTGR